MGDNGRSVPFFCRLRPRGSRCGLKERREVLERDERFDMSLG